MAAAEAGANHAVDLTLDFVRRWRANGFATPAAAITSLLLGPDTLSGTVATDADNGSLESWDIPRPPARLTLPGAAGATYEVRLFDEDDPQRGLTLATVDQLRITENGQPAVDANDRVLIRTIGYAVDGTLTSVEVMLVPAPAPAIVSNGDLTVDGNASVLGTHGNVHSNAALEVGGSADIDGNATASGGYTEIGNPDIGGSTSGSAPGLPVIDIHAVDYRYLADLVLTSGGVITDLIGGVICDASADAGACVTAGYTWRYDGADGWSANALGANADNRTFYAESDLTITGNMGTIGNPWNLTLIAEATSTSAATARSRRTSRACCSSLIRICISSGEKTRSVPKPRSWSGNRRSWPGTYRYSASWSSRTPPRSAASSPAAALVGTPASPTTARSSAPASGWGPGESSSVVRPK